MARPEGPGRGGHLIFFGNLPVAIALLAQVLMQVAGRDAQGLRFALDLQVGRPAADIGQLPLKLAHARLAGVRAHYRQVGALG